jgi:hypothetical protein
MTKLSCGGVARRLSAFHDGELPVEAQVAVAAHVRACRTCASEVAGVRGLGDLIRTSAAARAEQGEVNFDRLQADIMARLAAEREESVPAQVSRAFEDMRLGFAALGSTVATLVSILIVIGIFSFGPRSERSDSIAGLLETMGAPTVGMDSSRIMMPRAAGEGTASDLSVNEEDAVFALSAVVTRNGRIVNLEYASDQGAGADRERVERLLDELKRARFEPARRGGAPVAVKTVFLLAHTTVRGKMPITPKQSALPMASRPIVSLS